MEDRKFTISGNTEFMSQGGWIAKALMDKNAVLGFFAQFQYAFGVYANPKGRDDLSKFKGLHMSVPAMAEAWKDAGYQKMTIRTIEENLKILVEIGAISKVKVTPHPRSPIIYVINEDSPFCNQALAEKLAVEARNESKYKDQAKNSAAKKARESTGETKTIQVARAVARELTDNNKLKGFVVDYLNSTNDEHTVTSAHRAVKSVLAYGKVTAGSFENGLNDFSIVFTREEELAHAKMRDILLKARQEDRGATSEVHPKPAQSHVDGPTIPKLFKTTEEIKEEDKMRTADIEAEHTSINKAKFAAFLDGMDL